MSSTTTTKQRVVELIYEAIDSINDTLPDQRQLDKAEGTVLFGSGTTLDSLGLVNLLVSFEQQVIDEVGVPITLADERAMSQRNSPFRTVDTLADYAMQLIQESADA